MSSVYSEKGKRTSQGTIDQLALFQSHKCYEASPLEQISGVMKEKKVTGNSQWGFTTAKWCLANSVIFCDKM